MKKIGIIISIEVFIVAAFLMGYWSNKNTIYACLNIFVMLLPLIFSVIPLFKEIRIAEKRKKNPYSDKTFTDRIDDVNAIIKMLERKEHIIQIKGSENNSGKSWLGQKLCDIINHPKDAKFLKENNLKVTYHRAYYLDMNEKSESEVDEFLIQNTVDPLTVLVFDHVTNIEFILTKQSVYHFQLVYIMKEECSFDFYKHDISPFKVENIEELHNKIREQYTGISALSSKEMEILHRLTNGNIGQIHNILSRQEAISWIKDIADDKYTEYDEKLNKIRVKLLSGEYISAQTDISKFEVDYKKDFQNNNDLFYKYIIIKSDFEHLLNNYEDAIALLSTVELNKFQRNNVEHEIELHKAHYHKHLWQCDSALEILYSLKGHSYSAMADSLGILVAKYFINDLHVPTSSQNSLEEFKNMYICLQNSSLKHSDNDLLKWERNTAIYIYYNVHPQEPQVLISKLNDVIEKYEAWHSRLSANAYFLRGEIYRLYADYEHAIADYKKSLTFTYDNNLKLQVNLMVYYLLNCKKVDVNFDLLDTNTMIEMCKRNTYARQLWQRINLIQLEESESESVQNCFDNRIMTIL